MPTWDELSELDRARVLYVLHLRSAECQRNVDDAVASSPGDGALSGYWRAHAAAVRQAYVALWVSAVPTGDASQIHWGSLPGEHREGVIDYLETRPPSRFSLAGLNERPAILTYKTAAKAAANRLRELAGMVVHETLELGETK